MIRDFFEHLLEYQEFREEQWQSVEEHELLYKAIRDRDVVAAQQVMTAHLRVYEKFTPTEVKQSL
jgi:DNA-binding GntR family transcriptional regulator